MEEMQFQSGVWRIEEPNEAKFNQSDEKGVWEPKAQDILAIFEKLEQCSGGPIPLKWACPGRKPPEKHEKQDEQAEEGMDVDGDESKEEELRAPEMSAFDFDEFQTDVNAKLTPRAGSGGLGRTPRPEKRVAKMDNIMDSLRKQHLQKVAEREARRKNSPGTPPGRSRLLNFRSPGPKSSLSKPTWSTPGKKSESPPRTGGQDGVLSRVPTVSAGDSSLRSDNSSMGKSSASSNPQQETTLDAQVSELTLESNCGSASRPDDVCTVSISLPDGGGTSPSDLCGGTSPSDLGGASRSDVGSTLRSDGSGAVRPDNGTTSDAVSTSIQDGGSASRSDVDSTFPEADVQNAKPEQNTQPSPEVPVKDPTDCAQIVDNGIATANNGAGTSINGVGTTNNVVGSPNANNPLDSKLFSVSTASSHNADCSNTAPRTSDLSPANREQSTNASDCKTSSPDTNESSQSVVENSQQAVGRSSSSPPLVTVTSPSPSVHSTSAAAVPEAYQPAADSPITGDTGSDPVVPVSDEGERDNATERVNANQDGVEGL